MKKILLILTLISTMTLPLLADETERSIEEIHNVTPIEDMPQVNKDGLEYFEAKEEINIEGSEPDLVEHSDDEDFDDEDLDDEDFDDEDFDDDDFDDDDFDDEDFDDDDEDLTGGELEDEDFEDDE